MPNIKKKQFKDMPTGILHAGSFNGKYVWHSEDGGKTWWSGFIFSSSAGVTRKQLMEMAVSIIQDLPKEHRDAGN